VSKPALTPQEEAAVQASKDVAEAGIAGADLQVTALEQQLDNHQLTEDAAKKFFDFQNDDIVRQYELERRHIDGLLVADPISEVDLQAFVDADASGRLWNGGAREPVRIAEFDGTPLAATDDTNEVDQLLAQAVILDRLQNGISGQIVLPGTVTSTTLLNAASTSLQITSDIAQTISIGNKLLVQNTNEGIVITVTSTPILSGAQPPFIYDFSITVDFIQFGDSIAATATVGATTFIGFTDGERTAQTAAPAWRQGFLDEDLFRLQTSLTKRQLALTNEITALQANQSDTLGSTPETQTNDSLTAVGGFLGGSPPGTIDISDTGITAFGVEDVLRTGQNTARVPAIAAELVTEDSFDLRFNFTVLRIDLGNGTLAILDKITASVAFAGDGKAAAQQLSDRYTEILP